MKLERILSGMIAHAEKVLEYAGSSDGDELPDMVLEACVFNLCQIGELAGRIDETFRLQHPEIA